MKSPIRKLLPLYARVSSALAREATYAGQLPIARLSRLIATLDEPSGELEVDLHLGRDASRAPRLTGRVRGALGLVCQRCLRSFQWPLEAAIDLRLVFNEEEETRVLKDCEPYLVTDDTLPLHAIVEEEVLLAMPIAPRCGLDDCQSS